MSLKSWVVELVEHWLKTNLRNIWCWKVDTSSHKLTAQLFFSNIWGWFFMHRKLLYITGKVQICENDNRTSPTAHSWDPAINLYHRTQTLFPSMPLVPYSLKIQLLYWLPLSLKNQRKLDTPKAWSSKCDCIEPNQGQGHSETQNIFQKSLQAIKPRWCKHLGPMGNIFTLAIMIKQCNFDILAKHYLKQI